MPASSFDDLLTAATTGSEPMEGRLAAIAVRCATTWEVVAGKVVIAPERFIGREDPRILLDLNGVVAWQSDVAPEKIAEWLRDLARGDVKLAPRSDVPFRLSGPSSVGWRWSALTRMDPGKSASGFPELLLRGAGDNIGDVVAGEALREWERRLPVMDPPFASWSHLNDIMGLDFDAQTSTSRSLDVSFLTPLRIASVSQAVQSERIFVEIEGAPDAVPTAAVVFLPLRHDLHARAKYIPSAKWTGAGTLWRAELATGGISGPVEVALVANGVRVDRRVTGFPNARMIAHEWIDDGSKELASALAPRSIANGDQRAFEEAVAALLHVCGFASIRYGQSKLQRAPDVIAMDPRTGWLVVECSVELPGVEKLKKLKSRARDMWHRLKADCPTVPCLPLMFVPVARDRIGTIEEELFGGEHVGLACSEDIAELLAAVQRGEPIDVCWSILLRCQSRFGTGIEPFPE